MKPFQQVLLSPVATILDALRVIDASALEVALIIDKQGTLLGTVTDGDIRRSLLKGRQVADPAVDIMNPRPFTVNHGTPEEEILFQMSRRSIKQIPIVDEDARVVDLVLLKELLRRRKRDNWAVIMAGGLGKRLGELTRETPKPLLPVGGKPLLGTLISQLRRYGFHRIFVAVNYLAAQIKSFLGDGENLGVTVSYLEEKTFLGTAGALSLLPEPPKRPILVINGDILASVNFDHLMQTHEASGKAMTVCIREFRFQIPYGIVKMRGADPIRIQEKPTNTFYINSGVYVLEPKALAEIPAGEFLDMPELINTLIEKESGVGCFPLADFWLDIGRVEDYQRAQLEFIRHFSQEGEES